MKLVALPIGSPQDGQGYSESSYSFEYAQASDFDLISIMYKFVKFIPNPGKAVIRSSAIVLPCLPLIFGRTVFAFKKPMREKTMIFVRI
jgi:hypothetical protein